MGEKQNSLFVQMACWVRLYHLNWKKKNVLVIYFMLTYYYIENFANNQSPNINIKKVSDP